MVGEAAAGPEAVERALELQPDVVMDLHLPGANGIEATRRIVERSPHVGVLVLTMFNDDDSGWLASAPLPLRISSGGLDSSLLDGLSRVPCAGARCAQPSGRVGALPPGELAILEACCFVGAGGGIAGAVRMSGGAR